MESGAPHLAILLTYPEAPKGPIERSIRLAPPPPKSDGNRVAFIGLGNYAKGVLLPALKKASKVALSTVVTSTGVSAGHAGEKNGFAVIATDPAAALADPETDTIFVATRHDTHASLAAAALRAANMFFAKSLWP
jgi:polar amino acid transport system substrate-binding protein